MQIKEDTLKLLHECDKGLKMGIASIDDVIDYASSEKLKESLNRCKDEHERIEGELKAMLNEYGEQTKKPGAIITGMSKLKTNMKLAFSESDKTIADLMIDGCNMGTKSLSKYLNQYEAAEERAKDITKKLIAEEDRLSLEMRLFL